MSADSMGSDIVSPFALFVGGRTGYKNFALAVEACAEVEKLHLFVVGGGPLAPAQRSLLELRLRGRYQYLGYVTDEELKRLYRAAYCLIYPSSFEGFGIPVLEAMAQGCPVVCLRIPSIEEIAGDVVLFCSDPTTHSLVVQLRRLLDPDLRDFLVKSGAKHARQFSWDATAERTSSFYKHIAE
ncbi:glycosyltransferase family 4 protein [Piscinibacter sakaiensis]|uniref:glycosyltransferase family 4 protein n=1 Tax=Piscinibacter sakaiensis TaxID=1547922 RepID=UPI001E5F79AB|nr:glycosyltransferase family 1 protein [Piscinibacter sakaiensis]